MEKTTVLEKTSDSKAIGIEVGRWGLLALFLAALGGIYVVGLEPMPWAHDTFHDTRHATGFPCH